MAIHKTPKPDPFRDRMKQLRFALGLSLPRFSLVLQMSLNVLVARENGVVIWREPEVRRAKESVQKHIANSVTALQKALPEF